MRKLIVGGLLAVSTLLGGAIGASMIGTASAQTTSTTAPAADSSSGSTTAPTDKANCPHDGSGSSSSSDSSTPTTTPAT